MKKYKKQWIALIIILTISTGVVIFFAHGTYYYYHTSVINTRIWFVDKLPTIAENIKTKISALTFPWETAYAVEVIDESVNSEEIDVILTKPKYVNGFFEGTVEIKEAYLVDEAESLSLADDTLEQLEERYNLTYELNGNREFVPKDEAVYSYNINNGASYTEKIQIQLEVQETFDLNIFIAGVDDPLRVQIREKRFLK